MKFSLAAGSLAWLFGLVSASQYAIFHQDGDATLASQPNHTLIFTHSVERQSWILEQFEEGINIGNAGNGLYVKCGLQSGASCEAADTPTTFDLSPQGDNSYTVNVLHGDLLWTVKNDVLYLELADGSDSQRFILSKTSGIVYATFPISRLLPSALLTTWYTRLNPPITAPITIAYVFDWAVVL